MAKSSKKTAAANQPETLKGWKQIAEFLGEPVSVVERWASEGMPVFKHGRSIVASPEQLSTWLEAESGKPVHFASSATDLTSELKRGIAFARSERKKTRSK